MRIGNKAHTMLTAITKHTLRTSISQNTFSVWTKLIIRKHPKHNDYDNEAKYCQTKWEY